MRDHGSDDLMTRGARAAFWSAPSHLDAIVDRSLIQPTKARMAPCVRLANLRVLSASDAALARAIDAVPGRYHAGRDLRPFMTLEA